MLITMLAQVSGLRDGKPWPPVGHTLELPDAEAIQLVQNQMAVPAVDPDTGVEIAVRDIVPEETRAAANREAAREALVKTTTARKATTATK